MALPSTGSISMSQVRTELGRSNTITLNDSDVRSLAGKASGTISMNDLRGKSSSTHQLTVGTASGTGFIHYGYNTHIITGQVQYGRLSPNKINNTVIDDLTSDYNNNQFGKYYGFSLWVKLGNVSKIKVEINGNVLEIKNFVDNPNIYRVNSMDNPGYATQLTNIFNYLKNNLNKTVGIKLTTL